jgi:hypothetical protein
MMSADFLRLHVCAAAAAALLAAGCASFDAVHRKLVPRPAADRQCEEWFAALDAAVEAAGVRDAEATRIDGFPQMRVDRFLASFRETAAGKAALAAWLERMRELDRAARTAELSNLPEAALAPLNVVGKSSALDRSDACGRQLTASDLNSPARVAALRAGARVPDDYATWQRVLGIYPLTRLPFSAGIRSAQDETLAAFRAARSGAPAVMSVQSYAPESPGISRQTVARIMRGATRDALGLPRFTSREHEQLLAAYAPVLDVETAGDHDRLGHPRLDLHGRAAVDASRPVLFGRVALTRYGEATLLQLVYTGWFSERPSEGVFDILAGALDGIVWRATVAPDGEPLAYDSIHPCGCYHMFFPTPRAEPLAAPDPEDEWAFVPAALADVPADARIRIRVAARTHYLIDVTADSGTRSELRYALAEEELLRALPLPGGGTRSLYRPDGLVAGSERLERFLFWPMGVPSAGTMRQWGRHSTAFLGRRHFDDADLIERRFRLDLR